MLVIAWFIVIMFDIPKQRVKFNVSDEMVQLTPDQETEVESTWIKSKDENSDIFNGTHYSFTSIVVAEDTVTINVNKTDFKRFLWMRGQKDKSVGITPIGTGVYIVDDKFLYLVRRKNVSVHKGKYATVVGSLDYHPNISAGDFMEYIMDVTINELSEEVVTNFLPVKEDLRYIGFVYLEDTIVRFRFLVKGKILACKGDENTELLPVRITELHSFVKTNRLSILPSDVVFLNYFFCNKTKLRKLTR